MKKIISSLAHVLLIVTMSFGQSENRNNTLTINMFGDKTVPVVSEKVKNGIILQLKPLALDGIIKTKAQKLKIRIPSPDRKGLWTINLEMNSVVSDKFSVTTSQGKSITGDEFVKNSLHYRGKIEGHDTSLVAISFFKQSLMGVLSVNGTNYDLGEYKGKQAGSYVLYDAGELYGQMPFSCSEAPAGTEAPVSRGDVSQPLSAGCPGKKFGVYFECDYQMYLDRGSDVTGVVNYVTGLFNVVDVLFNNDGFDSEISQLYVWTTADPYRALGNSSDYLYTFRATRTNFSGNLAHLLSTRSINVGGIAWLSALCNTSIGYAFSNIWNSYQLFPTYSWSVGVVAHEIGHNLGSPHTHSCSWPGGPIDNCGPLAGYPSEGGCANGPTPTNGGTIMSYCHVTQYGINLNNGFGPLPAALIRDRIANASCLPSAVTLPATPGIIAGPTKICPDQTIYNYSISEVPNATGYNWTVPANCTLLSGQTTTSITVRFLAAFTSGSIIVTASNCAGTSSGRSLAVIKLVKPNSPGTISGPAAVCPDSIYFYSIAPVAGASSYNWTAPANAVIAIGQGTTGVGVRFPVGYIRANLSVNASNCGGASNLKTLTISPLSKPSAPGTISGTQSVCTGTYAYSVSPVANASSYYWIAPINASITAGQGTNRVSVDFAGGFTSGNLSVAASNCGGTSSPKTKSLTRSTLCSVAKTDESNDEQIPIAGNGYPEFNVSLYPNPFNNKFQLNVQSSDIGKKLEIRIFDMLGQLVLNQIDLDYNSEIELGSELVKGNYLVEVRQGDKLRILRIAKTD